MRTKVLLNFLTMLFMSTHFSNEEKMSCLLNQPGSVQYQFSGSPIRYGMEYSPTEQCKLQTGNNNTIHCAGKEVWLVAHTQLTL